jgi:hypothetical protein
MAPIKRYYVNLRGVLKRTYTEEVVIEGHPVVCMTNEVACLESENARLREALEEIEAYEDQIVLDELHIMNHKMLPGVYPYRRGCENTTKLLSGIAKSALEGKP